MESVRERTRTVLRSIFRMVTVHHVRVGIYYKMDSVFKILTHELDYRNNTKFDNLYIIFLHYILNFNYQLLYYPLFNIQNLLFYIYFIKKHSFIQTF